MRSARFARLSRQAALRLTIPVALILVGSWWIFRSISANWTAVQAEPFYTELPGVDLSGLTEAQESAVLRRLNRQRCACDCSRTVASCRVHHGCSLSLAAARDVVEAARKSRK